MSGSLSWSSLCKVFERFQPMTRAEKKKMLKKVFDEHRKASGGDMYALMRLLLPQLHRDADKRTFRTGLKESALATRIIEAMAWNKNSKDALRLKNFKQPSAGKGQGNFSNVLEDVLKDRTVKKGSLTAKDVGRFLDDLQASFAGGDDEDGEKANVGKKQTRLFDSILKKATAVEMKWIAREILQDMSAGLSETLVLDVYHPDAVELFKTNSNLEEVTERLKDPSFRLPNIELQLFTPCKSMLAEKLMDPKDVVKHFKSGFWMEPKYDGERLQLHKQGDTIRCFSRAGQEWTCLYQPLFDQITAQRLIKADTCILDGELCGWHREKLQWSNFYSLKPLALKKGGQMPRQGGDGRVRGGAPGGPSHVQEQDSDMEDSQLVFIAFDLLMLDGSIVVDKPLSERRDMLRSLVTEEKKVLEVIEWKVGETAEDVCENAEYWLTERLEGNLIKDPTSQYKAGSRDGDWMKLKPDYSCGVEFDVVLIGASYGSNKRGGKLWQFVCGIADKAAPGETPKKFRSFCRVGTGMKEVQFTEVSRMLRPHMRNCNPSKPQAALPSDSKVVVEKQDGQVVVTWQPSGALADDAVQVYFSGNKREELDVIIDPRHSIVLTLTADKRLIRSNVWMAARDSQHNSAEQKGKLGWTLRFPRIKQVRVMGIPGGAGDKPWYDCMTDEQLEEEIARSEDLSNYKMFSLADKPDKAGRKRKLDKVEGGILKTQAFHGRGVSKEYDALEGCELCVINGLDEKRDLEEKAARLGAEVVANPHPLTTTHVVAVTKDQKFKNHQKLDLDVIGQAWLSECWELKRHVPLEPKYMLHSSAETLARFRGEFDKFGDCYSKTLTAHDLQVLLQDPPNPKAWEDLDKGLEGTLSAGELQQVEDSLVEKVGRRRREGGDDGGQSQAQSLDLGTQSLDFGSQSMDSQSMDSEHGTAAVGGGRRGFGWSLFWGVRAVCVEEEEAELKVPGVQVAAACIAAGGGSTLDKAALRRPVSAGEAGEITHVVLHGSVMKTLGEKEKRKVLSELGLDSELGRVAVVSHEWVLESFTSGELCAEQPEGADAMLD